MEQARHASSGSPQAPLTVRQLGHELNSLLDGSLRYLGLAMRDLSAERPSGQVVRQLEAAHSAMWQMAELLERAMQTRRGAAAALRRSETVGQAVQWTVALVEPMAAAAGVKIATDVTPQAAGTPAGPLGTVLINGLRNAIRACEGAPGAERRVSLRAEIRGGSLALHLADTGTGPPSAGAPPEGRGEGLALCRRIVRELGGQLELLAGDSGTGAELRIRLPLERLDRP